MPGRYRWGLTGVDGQTITLPHGATDASRNAYHVDLGKLFVRERFQAHPIIDVEAIAANIERTRFPVPEQPSY